MPCKVCNTLWGIVLSGRVVAEVVAPPGGLAPRIAEQRPPGNRARSRTRDRVPRSLSASAARDWPPISSSGSHSPARRVGAQGACYTGCHPPVADRMSTTSLPTWLSSAGSGADSVGGLSCHGFHVLVSATAQSDVPQREACGWARAPVEAGKLARELGGFWHRLRMPLLGVTGESCDYIEALERRIGGRLDPLMRRMHLMEGTEEGRLRVLGFAALRHAHPHLSRRPFDCRTAQKLIDSLELLGRSWWRHALPEVDLEARLGLSVTWEPGTLVRACHAVLRDQPPQPELTDLDMTALALIGAAAYQVGSTRRCSVCFRWAEPGSETCVRHTSSDVSSSGNDERRAQTIDRARELARRVYGEVPAAERPMHGRSIGTSFWLNRTLWSRPVAHGDVIVDALARRMPSLPDLLEAMHTTSDRLPHNSLLLRLERHIDPLEVRPAAWLNGIELANAWYHWEGYGRLPKYPGCTFITRQQIVRAIGVALRDNAGRDDVAREIGVHPTLISQWLRRGQGDPDVEWLARLLGEASTRSGRQRPAARGQNAAERRHVF
jgi:hypothetical protein